MLFAFIISQNIQIFYPANQTPVNNPTRANPTISKSSNGGVVIKSILATVGGSMIICLFLFFMVHRRATARHRQKERADAITSRNRELSIYYTGMKRLIVDENGLDVIYWRELEGAKNFKNEHPKVWEETEKGDGRYRAEEFPLFRENSSTSSEQVWHQIPTTIPPDSIPHSLDKSESTVITLRQPPLPLPPGRSQESQHPIGANKSQPPPPPPPPPPPLPIIAKKSQQPPPPVKANKSPPSNPKATHSVEEDANKEVKLKPLHWDKVNTDSDHSMVWDKIDGGSFRFDGDLMESLFGYVATNRKSTPKASSSMSPNPYDLSKSPQIFILDPKKSQNTAIILRSISSPRIEIIDALDKGRGLGSDTLEKLVRISPTKEEESKIVAFQGDSTRLATAESFLFYVMKSVPTAFRRVEAMAFRSNYESSVVQHREHIQTLEMGCKELRSQGLFFKLLEAILKAGNRMNAGTAIGNALAFNLASLKKLSDVKSTDGNTTLLHFVVEQVVRSEGKRVSNGNVILNASVKEDDEYVTLGLPVVGALSTDFSNVKKCARIDGYAFSRTCSDIMIRVGEIRQLLTECCIHGNGGGFTKEMDTFLKAAEAEIRSTEEEERRVMEFVKSTADYYQSGMSKANVTQHLQIFVTVKDFLEMVNQACVDVARNLQKRKAKEGTSSSNLTPERIKINFPKLPQNFMSSGSNSGHYSDADDF